MLLLGPVAKIGYGRRFSRKEKDSLGPGPVTATPDIGANQLKVTPSMQRLCVWDEGVHSALPHPPSEFPCRTSALELYGLASSTFGCGEVRVVLSVWWDGGKWVGMRAKNVCAPKMGLSCLALHSNFIFPSRNFFWFGLFFLGGWMYWPGWVGAPDHPLRPPR